jgi:ubiquinone/menaquinone biosynthesis C-methylase UbiE
MVCDLDTLVQKPDNQKSAFWDSTSWRDEYYEQLMAMSEGQISPAQAAEREYWRIETATVAELMTDASHIADLGCGTGRVTWQAVEEYPAKAFVGVDISPRQLHIFEHRLTSSARRRLTLIKTSVSDAPLACDSLDLALFCNHTFGAILGCDRTRSLSRIAKALVSDGLLLIAGFSNLDLAPECYRNWGIALVSLDLATGRVELANHISLWEPAQAVIPQMEQYGFSLRKQQDFELGYTQVFQLRDKKRATE